MTEKRSIPSRFEKQARCYRRGGWGFLIIGSILLIYPVALLLAPGTPVLVNGVPHREFAVKLKCTLFVLLFPSFGALLVFTPRAKLARLLFELDGFMRSLVFGDRNRK